MKNAYTRTQLRDMADDPTVKEEVHSAYIAVLHEARTGKTEYIYPVKENAWGFMQKIVDGLKIYFPDSDVSLYSSNLIRIAW
jgi:hypothetical protein